MSQAFHEMRFPLRVSLSSSGGPVRRTDIVNLSNGREARNQRWAQSRRSYDAGSGIKSLADLYAVIGFFEARAGQLYGFRFRDPLDHGSAAPGHTPGPLDQVLGTGDGINRTFALVKTYGDTAGAWQRPIAKPVAETIRLAVAGVEQPASAFRCDATTGIVTFAEQAVPAGGATVTAGFQFDVPVRFDTDRIEVNLEAFNAGRIPSIPLMEILP